MMSPEEIYVNLGRLLEEAPDFRASDSLRPQEMKWMARAHALLNAAGMKVEAAAVQVQMDMIISASPFTRGDYGNKLLAAVHRALAAAELSAPSGVRGAFISAGSAFDAMAAVGRVLAKAGTSARIVDPYMDEKALTDFALLAGPSVKIELLADAAAVKATLKPATTRWKAQYQQDRHLEVRLSPPKALHDRLIIIDGISVYTLTQSLNAFAARSPASIVRIDGDASGLKVSAYEAFWQAATPL